MEDLQPCPFCGRKLNEFALSSYNEVRTSVDSMKERHFKYVGCICGARGAPADTISNAVKNWNHRVPLSTWAMLAAGTLKATTCTHKE